MVILRVAVSLCVIAALNYWSHYRKAPGKSDPHADPAPALTSYRLVRQSHGTSRPELIFEARKQVRTFGLDVAFQIPKGALGLLGASGSGKSMTLRCIAGIETPDEGRIVLNRRVLFDSAAKINVPA